MSNVNNQNEYVSLHNGIKLPEADNVEHPHYYNCHPSGIECIEIARHMDFNLGNVLKYIWRHGQKKRDYEGVLEKKIEDLEKASWYLNDEIEMLKALYEKKESLH